MRKITYSSNNSGGYWWLTLHDWIALEKAGWEVEWGGMKFCHSEYGRSQFPPICEAYDVCDGHKAFNSHKDMDPKKDLWLGSHATHASIITSKTMDEVINDWEIITGQNADDKGCHCCGQPHGFDSEEL